MDSACTALGQRLHRHRGKFLPEKPTGASLGLVFLPAKLTGARHDHQLAACAPTFLAHALRRHGAALLENAGASALRPLRLHPEAQPPSQAYALCVTTSVAVCFAVALCCGVLLRGHACLCVSAVRCCVQVRVCVCVCVCRRYRIQRRCAYACLLFLQLKDSSG